MLISIMKPILLILISLIPFQAISQDKDLKWFKGNTHTHSLWSDGNEFPEMIIDWYKTNGYDFISLSDHNILADHDKWVQLPTHPLQQSKFKEYLEKYGSEWVTHLTDSAGSIRVKLKTLAEYQPLFEEKDKFLIMKAEEITDKFEKKPVHVGAVNIRDLIKPQGGNSVAEVMQNNLDQVYEQREKTGQPMFAHINHPNFGWAIKLEDMMQLKGERFFEVYNGHPHVHNYGDSTTMGMEELWDKLLVHYIAQGKELVYGLATDDAHDFLEYRVGTSNPGRGWIMVRARELKPDSLISAMEKGDFYATTGVELEELTFDNQTLSLSVRPQQGVKYTIQFWGAFKTKGTKQQGGILFKEANGPIARYKLRKTDLYVRAKIVSDKKKDNPYAEGEVETAWTQPVMRR